MTKIELLGNALGTIQALCNFLEASPKQHALFSDTDQVRGENLKKDAEVIECPAMVMKAGKAVYRQMEHIVKALLGLFAEKDPKTYSESRTLLTAICNMEFIFGLCVLTNNLCRYLQSETVDVISARRNADMTIQTLHQCRSEKSSNSVCQIASAVGLKIKSS